MGYEGWENTSLLRLMILGVEEYSVVKEPQGTSPAGPYLT